MKNAVLISVLVIAVGALAAAQQAATNEAETAHYRVYSSLGASDAQSVGREMEAYFKLFNSYFHFNPSALPARLQVRIFGDKSEFDNYLAKIIPGQRNSFVYLQYSDASRSVLVGYHSKDATSFQTNLVHHGFVQFLKSFVPQPPLWLLEGFAVYFENSRYDSATGAATFRPNLGWLPTLKQVVERRTANDTSAFIGPETLLTVDAAEANKKIDAFYAESWGLVTFLLDSSNKSFNRVLWDALCTLNPKATRSENEAAIRRDAFDWVSGPEIEAGFNEYVNGLKTFPELVQDGMKAYSAGNLAGAEADFKKAVSLDASNYLSYYYLGLVGYARKDYYLAEQYFQTALQMGGDPGLVNYALGINAFADNRIADAKKYLTAAASVQSSYKDKAASLLDKINQQSAQ